MYLRTNSRYHKQRCGQLYHQQSAINGIKSSIRNIVNATESMKHALQMRIYISRFNYVDSDSHKVRIMMRQINAKKKNHKHISYKVPTFQIFITKFLWRHFLQDDF